MTAITSWNIIVFITCFDFKDIAALCLKNNNRYELLRIFNNLTSMSDLMELRGKYITFIL